MSQTTARSRKDQKGKDHRENTLTGGPAFPGGPLSPCKTQVDTRHKLVTQPYMAHAYPNRHSRDRDGQGWVVLGSLGLVFFRKSFLSYIKIIVRISEPTLASWQAGYLCAGGL